MIAAVYADNAVNFEKAASQRALVLMLLRNGEFLTRETALNKYHIWNLPTRIKELRDKGYKIRSVRISPEYTGVSRAVRYVLEEGAEQYVLPF
jgi:hypothetical protein